MLLRGTWSYSSRLRLAFVGGRRERSTGEGRVIRVRRTPGLTVRYRLRQRPAVWREIVWVILRRRRIYFHVVSFPLCSMTAEARVQVRCDGLRRLRERRRSLRLRLRLLNELHGAGRSFGTSERHGVGVHRRGRLRLRRMRLRRKRSRTPEAKGKMFVAPWRTLALLLASATLPVQSYTVVAGFTLAFAVEA